MGTVASVVGNVVTLVAPQPSQGFLLVPFAAGSATVSHQTVITTLSGAYGLANAFNIGLDSAGVGTAQNLAAVVNSGVLAIDATYQPIGTTQRVVFNPNLPGSGGNAITLTTTMSNASASGSTLAGGTDYTTNKTLNY